MATEAVNAAIAAAEQKQANHHIEQCPRCQWVIRVPLEELRATAAPPPAFEVPVEAALVEAVPVALAKKPRAARKPVAKRKAKAKVAPKKAAAKKAPAKKAVKKTRARKAKPKAKAAPKKTQARKARPKAKK